MGKSTEAEMANPLVNRSDGFHALTRAEEENCFKELKKNALKMCEVPIKGTTEFDIQKTLLTFGNTLLILDL